MLTRLTLSAVMLMLAAYVSTYMSEKAAIAAASGNRELHVGDANFTTALLPVVLLEI